MTRAFMNLANTPHQALERFRRIHASMFKHDKQRAGQRFVNMFLKDGEAIPGLFYQENDTLALWKIRDWLDANQYYKELPSPVLPKGKTRETVRFRDLSLGQHFYMVLGGVKTLCVKLDAKTLRTEKLNRSGFLDVEINPELNDDNVELTTDVLYF